MKKNSLVLSLVFLFVLLGGFSVVYAQGDDSDTFTLEEVTVTANKMGGEQNLQKMSMSIEVMQGEKIRNTGRTTMEDILKDMPNVSTSDAGGSSTINIRGLGMDLPVGEGTGEASVSTNFDGANQSRPEGQLFGFFDIERVEVLRGPQGTLYGRNATGGAINIISTKPTTDEVKGYTSLEVGNYDKMKAEGAINIPISDTFAARLATVFTKQDQYLKDDHGFRDSMEGLATRLQLRYMPNDETTVNLLTSYYKMYGSTFGGTVLKENWDAGKYDINRNEYPYDMTRKSTTENFKMALNVETPVGPGIFTFLPTYEKVRNRTSVFGFDGPPGAPRPDDAVAELSLGGRPWNNESRTVEMRYASKNDSTIKWVGGIYYTETDEPHTPRYGDYLGGRNNTPGPQPEYWYESGAAFANATVPLSDSLRLVLGARYSYDKKGYDDTRYDPATGSFKFDYIDWKVGIENDFSENVMGYLTFSTGHKPGGYNADTSSVFDEESAISGELGIKSRLMDNRIQLNGDIFYYDYDGYQTVDVQPDDSPDAVFPYIQVIFFNADKARVLGGEIEASFLVGSGTLFSASGTYLNNEYTSDFFLYSGAAIPTNLKGAALQHSPEFSVKLSAEHQIFLPDGSSLTPNVSWRWTDEQYVGVINAPEYIAPAYDVLDVSFLYASAKNWSLNVYCNNALDEHYYTSIEGAGSPTTAYIPGTPPLTAGVVLNVNF